MKKITLWVFAALMLVLSTQTYAQDDGPTINLGSLKAFKTELKQQIDQQETTSKGGDAISIRVEIPGGEMIGISLNFEEVSDGSMRLVGKVAGLENSSFYLQATDAALMGNILLQSKDTAYEYGTDDDGEVFLAEKPINGVLCIGLPEVPALQETTDGPQQAAVDGPELIPANLQSLPGAESCIYLDYDGHYLPPGSRWNNGNPINAAPFNLNDAGIVESWEVVAEDYRPFNINVTTNKGVFDSYPPSRRQWVVFTPTNTAAPGAGGVAYVNSFGFIENEVCWVFQGGAKFSGEAASHEVGHTLGLRHDGRSNPNEAYFRGHGDWAPIMGVGYGKPITQFSRGEYNNANNLQDDYARMDDFIRFRGDDHGNNQGNATAMGKNASGALNRQTGVISRQNDRDMFRFTCGTGDVTMDINTVNRHGNLDILVRLYEGASGNQIGVFNGNGLNTRLTAFLGEGTYYVGVEGTGSGNPATNGYSDYASLGSYSITGNVPAGGDGGGGDAIATLYENCPFNGWTAELGEGRFTRAQLEARGFINDRASSMRLQAGYTATLFVDDNFSGASIQVTGDDSCFNDSPIPGGDFNDKLSSMIITRTGSDNNNDASTFIEAENYSAMNGVQTEASSEGGLNVGFIDVGDWMAYGDINFPSTGSYRIEYRVASINDGRRLTSDLNSGSIVLGEVNIPNTGGWQNWTTVSQTVNVNAGTYQFGIYAPTNGWNINWIRITEIGNAAASTTVASTELIPDLEGRIGTKIYPNPAVNSLQLSYEGNEAKVAVYDLSGRQVVPFKSVASEEAIDVSGLNKGMYMVVIDKDGTKETKRLIKK